MAKMGQDPKRSFPGGFLLFLLAAFLLIFGIQSFSSDSSARVSFSHQLEHLINLHLTVPEENRKVAQNDHLVTFSGRFRDQLPEESADRYRYLEILQQQHSLAGQEAAIRSNLERLRGEVQEVATSYLRLLGQPVARGGFVIVGPAYDTATQDNSVVIHELKESNQGVSLPLVEIGFEEAVSHPTPEVLATSGKEIRDLIRALLSPQLGIGVEAMKADLRQMDVTIVEAAKLSKEDRLAVYRDVLGRLRTMIGQMGSEEEGVRLKSLRSVRSYVKEALVYDRVSEELQQNTALLDKAREKVNSVVWYFHNQELSTNALEKQDPEEFSRWFTQAQYEWGNYASNRGLAYRAPDQPRNTVLEKTFQSEEPSPNYFSYIFTFLPFVLVIVFLYFIFSKQMKGVGSSAMNFGKSPARLMTKENNRYTFKDVAGADEAKEELTEIVDFLKDPHKFTALGARIPKGVLLVGPPGTGKTLIAKAVAGEADRPFFSISGSDFVEMFVGVGASRIRDLFDQAKKHAPCIIFMDEIDAVGRHRGAGIGGGHDEREQTLNQLLVEMDGFDTREGVILMAATNRPDVLDRALLRPGRFDRRVVLDLPDVRGRFEILKVHARKIKMDASVDLEAIAKLTPGSSGADLENILNEAALLAARQGRSAVTSSEVKESCDKVRFGKERRSLEMDQEEKKTTAYHESGHAVVGLVVKHGDPVDKVTIIPRGFSLGATHFMPKKNRLGYWKKEVLDQLAVLMGGRAAEEIFVKDMSSGAQHDISQATKFARRMVCEWGMTELGTVTYDEGSDSGRFLAGAGFQERSYSEETAKLIDAEVKRLISEAHDRAIKILEDHRLQVELMTAMLMIFETLDSTDIQEIMDGSWDIERKRGRDKAALELQRKNTPPPPPVKSSQDIQSKESLGTGPGIQPAQ
jgi:cell division protease FtsH